MKTDAEKQEKDIETAWFKLTPSQFVMFFSCVTACISMPALLLFYSDYQFFKELDFPKLILLCFSSSSPMFCGIYGVFWMDNELSGKKSRVTTFISGSMAVTITTYTVCFLVFIFDIKKPDAKSALLLPLLISIVAVYVLLIYTVFKNRRKKPQSALPDEKNKSQVNIC